MLLFFKLERKNLLFLCIKIVIVIFISLLAHRNSIHCDGVYFIPLIIIKKIAVRNLYIRQGVIYSYRCMSSNSIIRRVVHRTSHRKAKLNYTDASS